MLSAHRIGLPILFALFLGCTNATEKPTPAPEAPPEAGPDDPRFTRYKRFSQAVKHD